MTALHGGTSPLAALTTVFTPPCPTTWLVTTKKLPSQYPSFPAAGAVTCDPPSWSSNLAGEGFQYYSPAICPDGFEVGEGCTIASTPRTAEGFPAVAPDETVAWCVPSGQACTSDTTDFRGGIWGVSRTASGPNALVTVGPAMQIRWRAADLAILATHPLTPGLVLPGGGPGAPPVVATPAQPTATSEAAHDSGDGPNTGMTGFITVTGKSTPATLTPATTIEVVTKGSTFVSTVLQTATAVVSHDAATGTGSSVANAANSMPNMRAFTATIVMASLLSITALGIAIFFFLSHRRRRRLQRQQEAQRTTGNNNTANPNATGLPHQDYGSSNFSAVGLGAWVRRKRPRGNTVWTRWARWLSVFSLSSRCSPLTGDNAFGRRRRRWQPRIGEDQQQQQVRQPLEVDSQGSDRGPVAEMESPIEQTFSPDVAELEGSPIPVGVSVKASRAESDADSEEMDFQKGILPQIPSSSFNPRLSWMSRLSRYMRGGRRSPGRGEDGRSDSGGSSSSRPSTARWSRGTRTDTESQWGAASVVTDGDYAAEMVDESSWEAFSRAQGGTAKLIVIGQKGSRGGSSPRPSGPGLSVPAAPGTVIVRLPSPAATVRSMRSERTTYTATPPIGGGGPFLGANRFWRLSGGTFGRTNSYISRDGSSLGREGNGADSSSEA